MIIGLIWWIISYLRRISTSLYWKWITLGLFKFMRRISVMVMVMMIIIIDLLLHEKAILILIWWTMISSILIRRLKLLEGEVGILVLAITILFIWSLIIVIVILWRNAIRRNWICVLLLWVTLFSENYSIYLLRNELNAIKIELLCNLL